MKSLSIERNTTHSEWDGKWLVTFRFDPSAGYEQAEEHYPPNVTPPEKKAPSPDRRIEKVVLSGSFQFYRRDEVGSYRAFAEDNDFPTYDAFSYRSDMFPAGSDVVTAKEHPYEMKKTADPERGEIYEITLPLPSGIYGYRYTILYSDGSEDKNIYDPQNMPLSDERYRLGQSELVLGTAEDEDEPLCYELKRQGAGYGTLRFEHYTAVDGSDEILGIWLPEGYSTDKKYRTLYISHGGGGNEVDWMSTAPVIIQNLIDAGKTKEAIIVTMNSTVFDWDMKKALPNIVGHVIPYVESRYPVLPGYENRAFCGLSMGSMLTNNLMRYHPEAFGYFGGFSGGIDNNSAADFKPEILRERTIYESVGCVDIAYNNTRGISTLDYLKTLDELEIPYTYDLIDGSHDCFVWRRSLIRFASDLIWK